MKLYLLFIVLCSLTYSVNSSNEGNTYKAVNAKIDSRNEKFEKEEITLKMMINKFSDVRSENFDDSFHPRAPKSNYMKKVVFKPIDPIPDEKDWRTDGAVTPVNDVLGQCDSAYAFSIIGAIESQHFIATKKLVELSAQQIVDCTPGGCMGGDVADFYNYIKDVGGVDTGDSYPYTGDLSNCQFDVNNVGATISGFDSIDDTEEALLNAVATVGPVSAGIYVTDSFLTYTNGVYEEDNCNGTVNHFVLVVGYGTEDEKDFWLVKNCWVS